NATQDDGVFYNVQPLMFHSLEGSMAIAHNGKIMNADNIRRDLEKEGSILQTTSDTEVLAHLIKKEEPVPTEDAVIRGLNELISDGMQDDVVFNNVQTLMFNSLEVSMAIAHNGKIMNADNIRRDLEKEGSILQTTSDTEVLAHLIKK